MRRLRHTVLLVREWIAYGITNESWWPLFVLLALFGMTVLLAASQAAAPFIYTIF